MRIKLYDRKSFLEAGLQIGFLISQKETYECGFIFEDTSKESEPNNFDFGVNFGAGFKSDADFILKTTYYIGQRDI